MAMRKQNGYALITIIVIGFLSIVFLLTLAGIVTSAVRVLSVNKYTESLRNAAEIGIEYAVNQYNSQSPCPLDPSGAAPLTTPLLPPYLASVNANSGTPNVAVNITVTKLVNPKDWLTFSSMSSIYSPQLDPNRGVSTFKNPTSTSNMTASGGGYRIVQSVASNGIYSRAITVVLKARFDPPPDGTTPLMSGSPPNQSLFNSPMFSNGALTLGSTGLTVQGYNSQTQQGNTVHTATMPNGTTYNAYDLNVITNTAATLAANNVIGGDLTVLSNSSGSAAVAQVAPGQQAIDGRLMSNGNLGSVAFTANNFNAQPGDNVLANADQQLNPTTPRAGLNYSNPGMLNTPAVSQTLSAPVPSSASTEPIAQLSALAQQGTRIPGGMYSTAGLSTTGMNASNPIVIQNGSSPVTFFVQDSGSAAAVNIDTSIFQAQNFGAAGAPTQARNLQIYYQGTDAVNINISGGNFSGLIYAPNAPVSISGTGNFYGAMAGASVNATLSGNMFLYTDLAKTPAPPSPWPSSTQAQTALAKGTLATMQYPVGPNGFSSIIQGWQPITWQESNPLSNP
jgi:hypothetical protein